MSRLTYTRGMSSSDPFKRAAEKLYQLRREDPCEFTWQSRVVIPGDEHTHRCAKHRVHGVDHKCNCGAVAKRKG